LFIFQFFLTSILKGGEFMLVPEEKTAISQAVQQILVNRIPPQQLELIKKAIVVAISKYDELRNERFAKHD